MSRDPNPTAKQRSRLSAVLVGAGVTAALAIAPALAGTAQDEPAQTGERSIAGAEELAPAAAPAAEAIVAFRPRIAAERRRKIRRATGVRRDSLVGLRAVEVVSVDGDVRAAVRDLRRRPAVRYAEVNRELSVRTVPDDPGFAQQWGLQNTGQLVSGVSGTAGADIDAPAAWDVTTGSSDVVVAVVDTGVAYQHPDLAPQLWENPGESATPNGIDDDGNGFVDDRHGWDFVRGNHRPRDLDADSHGTHVAGTIGAKGSNGYGVTGVAWDVSLMPVRVADANGQATIAAIANGFAYAAANGADVVNISLGGPGVSPTLENAINAAPETLFVAAAGNSGSNNDVNPDVPCSIQAENLICVAATNQNDLLAAFSNFGPGSVHLAAPGTRILSTFSRGAASTVFSESFETPIEGRWTTAALPPTVHNTWARTTQFARSPVNSLADSPGANYAPSTDSVASAPPIDLSGREDCVLQHHIRLNLDADPPPNPANPFAAGDFALVERSPDGLNWSTVAYWGLNTQFDQRRIDATALDGQPAARVRLGLWSDADGVVDQGVFFDDVSVECYAESFALLQGTSMAAPHVAGVAALLLSHRPGASVAEVRDAILAGVDVLPSLDGAVATGGRLNAAGALAAMAPAPENVSPPTIEGTGRAGTMLTCNRGEWTMAGSYEYSWRRDDGDGFEPVEVGTGPGQTGSTNPTRYRAKDEEIGSEVSCRVRRLGANGASAPADSAPVEIVSRLTPVAPVPQNVSPPTISGTGRAGTMLTCHQGEWTLAGSYEFAWLLDSGSGPVPVAVGVEPGETGSTNPLRYRAKPEEIGSQVICRVTRSNAAGASVPANSAPTGIVPRD